MSKSFALRETVILILFFLSGSAAAHHSYAMYDRSKQITIVGVIEQFQMVNPHSWLDIIAQDSNGNPDKWSFEGGSYSQLIRRGVRASTLKVGDHVTVKAYPLRDGRHGGHVLTVTTADGTVFEMFPAGV
jgi:hypothetical protein